MKRAMLKIMRGGGAFATLRMLNRHKVLILTYHRFSETEDGRSTSSGSFAEQLTYLKAHYSLVPLSLIVERLSTGGRLPVGAAAITIDDGFRDSYEIAYPLLRKCRIPATLFVITDFLDQKRWLWTDKLRYLTELAPVKAARLRFCGLDLTVDLDGPFSRLAAATRVNSILKTLPEARKDETIAEIAAALGMALPELPPARYGPITWSQAREMEAAGIEIGSHTVTHPILPNTSDEQLDRELRGSRARLEEVLAHPVRLFCYPNGSFDQRVRLAAASAGYKCAVTTKFGLNDHQSDLLALRRVPAELDLDHFVQTTSGFEQVKIRLLRRRTRNMIDQETI